ncbi:MAG: HAD family hydrolase [Acidobacteria bacterium]|nr:HAD family hydrolase [Acidobacteriota bacterium]
MTPTQRKLLILDLDETLIHAAEEPLGGEPDFMIGPYFVYRRPFLDEFLEFCFENFEVAVWTSSTLVYAIRITANIFPAHRRPAFLWARERCTICFDPDLREQYFEKKMWKIRRRGYDLKAVVVVDDSPEKWRTAYGNLVRVEPFLGDREDDELKHLAVYLERLKALDNIRKFEKRNWRNRL